MQQCALPDKWVQPQVHHHGNPWRCHSLSSNGTLLKVVFEKGGGEGEVVEATLPHPHAFQGIVCCIEQNFTNLYIHR